MAIRAGTYLATLTEILWGEGEVPKDHLMEEVSEQDLISSLWSHRLP